MHLPSRLIEDAEVGKGSANINGDATGHALIPRIGIVLNAAR
jgi:hypothetical protein